MSSLYQQLIIFFKGNDDEYRGYKLNDIEEIKEVSGIGESRFEDMKDEITV